MNHFQNHPQKSSWLFFYIFFGMMIFAGGGAWWYASALHTTASPTSRLAAVALIQKSVEHQPYNNNRIVENDWGVSFIKNTQWTVVSARTTPEMMVLQQVSGQGQGNIITISYSVAARITDTNAAGNPVTYYLDPDINQWLVDGVDVHSGIAYTGVEAHPIVHLSDTLPVFLGRSGDLTYIIPLSFTTFLKLTIETNNGDITPLSDLLLTLQRV